MTNLELPTIAELLHEYHELIRNGSSDHSRLSRLDSILREVSLTGEQLMSLQEFDPLLLGKNDVKRSVLYIELETKYEKLMESHKKLEADYSALADKVRAATQSHVDLRNLIDSQKLH